MRNDILGRADAAPVFAAAAIPRSGDAQLIWFDPGVTTGICALTIDSDWLKTGSLKFEALGRAVRSSWFGEIGRHPQIWDGANSCPTVPHGLVVPPLVQTTANRNAKSKLTQKAALNRTLSGDGVGGSIPFYQSSEIDQVMQCQNLLDAWPRAAWGYEDFTVRTADSARDTVSPVRLGAMLALSEIAHGQMMRVPFTQMPSDAVGDHKGNRAGGFISDERIRACGLYRDGMIHATDAARHCVAFLRKCRVDPELRAQAFPRLFGSVDVNSVVQ